MHWQDALIQSKLKKAIRHIENGGYMIGTLDGFHVSVSGDPCKLRNSHPGEAEGFNDWEPVEPLANHPPKEAEK